MTTHNKQFTFIVALCCLLLVSAILLLVRFPKLPPTPDQTLDSLGMQLQAEKEYTKALEGRVLLLQKACVLPKATD